MKILIQESKRVHNLGLEVFLPFEGNVLPDMEVTMKNAGFDVKAAEFHLMPDGVYWEIENKEKDDEGLAVIDNSPVIHLSFELESKDKKYIIEEFKKIFEVVTISEEALPMEKIVEKVDELFVKKN
ncbi:MAG: hypothetical protein WC595_05465 [Candidatus Nanoarchaeia archaeon]